MPRLIRFTAENWMRLSAVAFDIRGNHLQLTGANGAGKSSVIEGIAALIGGKDAIPADPVRHGATHADLYGDFEDFAVTLRVNPDRSTRLVVKNKDGFKPSSPQKYLSGLFGPISIDPEAFARLKPIEQRDQLAALVGLKDMLDDLAMHDRIDYENRTGVNRELKQVEARLASMPAVDADEPVDVADMMGKVREAEAFNRDLITRANRRTAKAQEMGALRNEANAKREQAALLLDEADAQDAQADAIDNELSNAEPLPASMDVAALQQQIIDAEKINARYRAAVEREGVAASAAALAKESDELTAKMKQREAERGKVLAAAEFPVEGLSITETGVTYNGVIFEQASSGQKTRIAAAVAMRMNPELRIMFIRHGSLMDSKSRQEVYRLAEEHSYTVIEEHTDESGESGIYIEDGRIAAIDGVPTVAEAEAVAA